MLYNEGYMYRLALFEKGGDENLQFFLVLFFFGSVDGMVTA